MKPGNKSFPFKTCEADLNLSAQLNSIVPQCDGEVQALIFAPTEPVLFVQERSDPHQVWKCESSSHAVGILSCLSYSTFGSTHTYLLWLSNTPIYTSYQRTSFPLLCSVLLNSSPHVFIWYLVSHSKISS